MKKFRFSPILMCLLLVLLFIGCIPETEEVQSDFVQEALFSAQLNKDSNITKSQRVVNMLITYVPETSERRKNEIRELYTSINYLIDFDVDYHPSPDIELWHVRPNCSSCRPRVYHPNDPDIESSVVLSEN